MPDDPPEGNDFGIVEQVATLMLTRPFSYLVFDIAIHALSRLFK